MDICECYFEFLLAGDICFCFVMIELVYVGFNLVCLGIIVVWEGDEYVINGYKWFIIVVDGVFFIIIMVVINLEVELFYVWVSMIFVFIDLLGFELV